MNRFNQTINFSEQELQFLNNFSSIEDLYAFSKAFDEVVNKVDDLQYSNPKLFYALAGGLTGAGLGAAGQLLIGDKKKSKLRRMLEGGLIGGGLGAGAGILGGAYLKNKRDNSIINKSVEIDDTKIGVILNKANLDSLKRQDNNEGFKVSPGGVVLNEAVLDSLTPPQVSDAVVETPSKGLSKTGTSAAAKMDFLNNYVLAIPEVKVNPEEVKRKYSIENFKEFISAKGGKQ